MALMLLAHRWRERTDSAPRMWVVTVDHALRPESAQEAAWVNEQATALGFSHHTLVRRGSPLRSGIQSAARRVRYDLMSAFAHAHGLSAIVTAHTRDDQAETFLMRLARGSGLDGLAGMASPAYWAGIAILRPFLTVSRARLRATLREAGMEWLEDPSNEDTRFERVRVRSALRGLAQAGIPPPKLALSSHRLGRARRALDDFTLDFLSRHLRAYDLGYGEMALSALELAPEEVALKALGRAIMAFGGRPRPPRLAKLEALYAVLMREPPPQVTLGGCLLVIKGGKVIFCREPGRIGVPALRLAPGTRALWDGRFVVHMAAGAPEVCVAPLGTHAALVDKGLRRPHPSAAVATAPAFYLGERLLAVPGLSWVSAEGAEYAPSCCAVFANWALIRTPAHNGGTSHIGD